MPALPSFLIDPLGDQFAALLPERGVVHRTAGTGHGFRIGFVFDTLIQVLVLAASYARIADPSCSAATIRRRRDEWIAAGVFERQEQICLESYDRIVELDLAESTVDGCITKAPCG